MKNSAGLWSWLSTDELAAEQGVSVANDLNDLNDFAMPDRPTDETADDLIAYVRPQRKADRGA